MDDTELYDSRHVILSLSSLSTLLYLSACSTSNIKYLYIYMIGVRVIHKYFVFSSFHG